MIACTHDIYRPGFSNNRPKNLCENASDSKPMSCSFKNQTFCFSFRFLFYKDSVVFRNVFNRSSKTGVDGSESPGILLYICYYIAYTIHTYRILNTKILSITYTELQIHEESKL
jgi:hypothetical protein